MKNYLKSLLCMLMVLSVVFALFVPAFASFDTATAIVMDKAYSDSITSNDGEDYFKFTTTQYGRVRFYFETGMERYTITIYDSNKKEVKKFVRTALTIADDPVPDVALDAGTYYLKVTGEGFLGDLFASKGSYDFRMTFTAEIKGQSDKDTDKNNELKYAKEIKTDATSAGKILNDDENDYYKFVLQNAGSVTISFTSKMQYYCIYLLNANGDTMWSKENNPWDSSKKQRTDDYKFELSAGTYYIKVNSLKGSKFPQYFTKAKGSYEFDLYFKAAGATSVEPNNSLVNPNKISVGSKVNGHLSMTDGRDYYEFTAPKGGVLIAFVSYMPAYNIRVLDLENKEVWSSKNNALAEKATVRKDVHEVSLPEGKYFILVDGGTGKYNFQLSEEVNLAKVKTVKYTKSVTTLKLSWSKVAYADGYEVFRYDEAKKEFVKVGSTTSKRYLKMKKLKGGTTYDFKVRAYKKINGCYVYGEFSEEKSTTTNPARVTISSVKAGTKSATVNWKSVNGASGYRIFYTTDRDFDYATRVIVKDAKATSKTISKLKSGKKYYFKVRAYKVFNGKNVYGNLSKIKSVKVK